MASIQRHYSGRSPYYFASFLGDDGRWKRRSTKQTNRAKALEIALEWERIARAARSGTLTEVQCRKVLSEMLERAVGDTIRHVTVKEHFSQWLASKEATKAARTAERYEYVLRTFQQHLGQKTTKPLNSITPRDVQSFFDSRLKSGSSSKTVSMDRKALSGAFGAAFKHGVILHNPVLATQIPQVVSSEREVFTAAQVAMLAAQAPDDEWRTAILLAYFTGARLGDCVGMTWRNVDLVGNVLRYKQAKTGAQVEIPIHPQLQVHLSRLASTDNPQAYLCPRLRTKDSGGAHGLSQTFKAIMRAAGIDPGTAKGQGTRQFSKLTFHALRHSFNSALANAGVSQEMRMKLTGHKTAEMNRRYTHHELDLLKQAVTKLPSLCKV